MIFNKALNQVYNTLFNVISIFPLYNAFSLPWSNLISWYLRTLYKYGPNEKRPGLDLNLSFTTNWANLSKKFNLPVFPLFLYYVEIYKCSNKISKLLWGIMRWYLWKFCVILSRIYHNYFYYQADKCLTDILVTELFFLWHTQASVCFMSVLWALNDWCFWTVVLEKTLEKPLDCKQIKPVNPKGNQSWILMEDWCWSWSFNSLATWCKELTHWKRPWCWERLWEEEKGTTEHEIVGRVWVWVNSRSWWWTGKPGMLQSKGSQRLGHDWTDLKNSSFIYRQICITGSGIHSAVIMPCVSSFG